MHTTGLSRDGHSVSIRILDETTDTSQNTLPMISTPAWPANFSLETPSRVLQKESINTQVTPTGSVTYISHIKKMEPDTSEISKKFHVK